MNEKVYIERDAALTEFNKTCTLCRELVLRPMCDECSVADTIRHIKELHPADVAPIIRGKWISEEIFINPTPWVIWRCSNCGYVRSRGYSYDGEKPSAKFCENCGADMRGETDE